MEWPEYCYVTNYETGFRAEVQNKDGEVRRKDFKDKGEALGWATTWGIMLGVTPRGGARFLPN
jgi:hypothetical protein